MGGSSFELKRLKKHRRSGPKFDRGTRFDMGSGVWVPGGTMAAPRPAELMSGMRMN